MQNPDIRVAAAHEWLEQQRVLAPAEARRADADLEGRGIDAVPVGDPKPGRFTYFMDGMQRPRGPIYLNSPIPIVYGYAAAVIRTRGGDKRMRKHAHVCSDPFYFSYELRDPADLQRAGVRTSDTGGGKDPLEAHPMMMLQQARDKLSTDRAQLEAEITTHWLRDFADGEDWLLVDGSLCGDYDGFDSPNIVGVVKSHQTQYFPLDQQLKILDLKVGQRSGVFVPEGRNRPDVYSWYLRLRPNDGRDIYFGLVRVEAAKCGRTLDLSDEISRWLLAERSPLSTPDHRWDTVLYAVRDCELYLRSVAPSDTYLDSRMISLAHAG